MGRDAMTQAYEMVALRHILKVRYQTFLWRVSATVHQHTASDLGVLVHVFNGESDANYGTNPAAPADSGPVVFTRSIGTPDSRLLS
jgi:hypothetical protein